jgi:hypothetical protein
LCVCVCVCVCVKDPKSQEQEEAYLVSGDPVVSQFDFTVAALAHVPLHDIVPHEVVVLQCVAGRLLALRHARVRLVHASNTP